MTRSSPCHAPGRDGDDESPSMWTDERGYVGGVEMLPFGLLVFVVGTLIIVQAWAVIDTKLAVSAAAREAGRTVVELTGVEAGTGAGAEQAAASAASATMAGHGRTSESLTVTILDSDGEPARNLVLERCVPVTVRVETTVDAIPLPFGLGFGDGFTVTSSHTEIVDPFRSGIDTAIDLASDCA